MKKRIAVLLGLLFAASMAWGQITIPPGAVINNNAAAGGACSTTGPAQFNETGSGGGVAQHLYNCPAGTLVDITSGGGGSGTVSGQVSPCIPVASAATALTGPSSLCDNGTSVTGTEPISSIPNVSVASQALGYASSLQHFLNGSLVPKEIMWTGDSTVAVTTTKFDAMCNRTYTGQEFFGMTCDPLVTYSIDGSHNVTVVAFANLPANCVVGAYITITTNGPAGTNMVGAALETFQIASGGYPTNSFVFNNPSSAGSTGSSAANGNATCSFINNGANGSTQAAFNAGSGLGSLAFVLSQQPALNIHRGMGINDVRGGATSLSQLEALIKTYIDSVRASSPNTDIMLLTENSLLANDAGYAGGAGLVTSPSTTSSTAVAGAGSVTITLAAQLNAINGLITNDLTLAQEAANTQPVASPVAIAATTGSCTAGSTAVTLASGTAYSNGTMITIAGANAAAGTLTAQIQTGGGTTSITVFPQCGTTVAGAAVAESPTVYSAHLLVDAGAAGEIVPITAISGSTVTATFANAHSGTYTVIPTMATMAQGYSNILHDADMSFLGYAPNVLVYDTQTTIYGRLVQAGAAALNNANYYMFNQLHPQGAGQNLETAAVARILSQAQQSSDAQGAVQAATLPTMPYSVQAQYSPVTANIAQAGNYNSCWLTNYYQCVENPQYYTLIGSGILNAYTTSSFIRISSELNSLTASGTFGVIPCQGYDIVEFVGYGVVQLPSNSACSLTSTYTNISNAPAISFTMPPGNSYTGVPVRVYRAKYVDVTAEPYAKAPLTYKSARYATVTNISTTGFSLTIMGADPNTFPSPINFPQTFTTATDKIVVQGVGDLSTIVGSYTSMSCAWTGAANAYSCTGGTTVPAMASAYAELFYTQQSEQIGRRYTATISEVSPLDEAVPPAPASNATGNNKTIRGGAGSGNSTPNVVFIDSPALGTASGTTYQTNVHRAVYNDTKALTSGSATTLVSIPLATLVSSGGNIAYHLRATDGTNTCVLDGIVTYSAENSAGTFVTSASTPGVSNSSTACTAAGGTLTATWAVTSANPALVQITPTLSTMTATTFTIVYEVHAMGETNVTP